MPTDDEILRLGDVIGDKTTRITELERENYRLQEQNDSLHEWYANLKHLAKEVILAYDAIGIPPERNAGIDKAIKRLRLQVTPPVPPPVPEVNE